MWNVDDMEQFLFGFLLSKNGRISFLVIKQPIMFYTTTKYHEDYIPDYCHRLSQHTYAKASTLIIGLFTL